MDHMLFFVSAYGSASGSWLERNPIGITWLRCNGSFVRSMWKPFSLRVKYTVGTKNWTHSQWAMVEKLRTYFGFRCVCNTIESDKSLKSFLLISSTWNIFTWLIYLKNLCQSNLLFHPLYETFFCILPSIFKPQLPLPEMHSHENKSTFVNKWLLNSA